jgi:hypothetical protein
MATSTVVEIESRILTEGYGPTAWHGANLNAAVADVTPSVAFWRPAAERHNIAEIALHHAYCVRNVSAQISGHPPEPFILEGDDWFELAGEHTLTWAATLETLEAHQHRLAALVSAITSGSVTSPLAEAERFTLVLGITCHAIYHAGQIQLIKRLRGE